MNGTAPRIALISGGLPFGGTTTFLLNLAGELVRRSHPVMVGSLESNISYPQDFHQLGIPLHVEDDRARIFEDRIGGMLGRLREFRPDVVVACLGPSSFEVLRYLPAGVRRLGMIQSDFPENYPPFSPYVPYLDGMVGVSRQIATNLRKHPELGRIPTHCLPYGIPVPEQRTHRVAREPNQPLRILYLGRLEQPQKRVRLFPSILHPLGTSRLSFEWTIAGDGPEREWLLANLPPQAGNARVHFAGPIKYRDVPTVLQGHDVVLLASKAEGLPLSLLEAMAHGLVPVVSHLASGVSEVVDSTSSKLIQPDHVDEYAEAIIWLAQHPKEAAAMANRAADSVRREYSVSAMADRWLAVLDQLCAPKEASVNWPARFRIRGYLGHGFLRFTLPARVLRRWWRRRSSPAVRQLSTLT